MTYQVLLIKQMTWATNTGISFFINLILTILNLAGIRQNAPRDT